MYGRTPRIIVAGASSGCGKTTFTCALLSILREKGLAPASFKCGPDYIDKTFHELATGTPCYNLDLFFMGDDMLRRMLAKHSANHSISVIEGVMGYYDGTGVNGLEYSTYEIAKRTGTPAVLLLNARGSAASVLAAAEGLAAYEPDNNIAGFILNNTTRAAYNNIKTIADRRWNGRLRLLGYIPKLPDECILPDRHLGLVTAHELDNPDIIIKRAADIIRESVNIEEIIRCAGSAGSLEYSNTADGHETEEGGNDNIIIAAARDEAFCFYYEDNFELLEAMGCVIEYFSPLKNEPVPQKACGLILGGGYPENYADELAGNITAGQSVKSAIENNMPCIAECGGFMYLGSVLDGRPMTGALDIESHNSGRLVRFGYVTLTADKNTFIMKKGDTIRGHEFHYYDSTDNGDAFTAVKTDGSSYKCIKSDGAVLAGFPHLHFLSNPAAAANFAEACREYQRRRGY